MKVKIFNCYIDALTMNETVEKIKSTINNNEHVHHVVVNAAKLIQMRRDRQLYRSVVSADIINADGASVVWLSRMLRTPLPERITGIDLMEKLINEAAQNFWKCYFLGAEKKVVENVVAKYAELYGDKIIAGFRDGYFSKDEEESIINQVHASGTNILFVAISSPQKENFLHKYKKELETVNFIMGVGGSFDVISGKVKRAPAWMQRIGLEWFYRLIQEPKRMWKRYLITNTLFLYFSFLEFLRSLFGK